MMKSKFLRIFTALSIMAGILAPCSVVSAGTINFKDDFSEKDAKITDSSSNVLYLDAYTDLAHENFYSSFACVSDNTVGNSGYITYKVDGEISDFKIDVTWNNYANLGIWKVALSPDGNTWTEYEAYDSASTVITDKIKDDSGTVTGSVSKKLSEVQDSSIPDLTVSVDSTQAALVQSTASDKLNWCKTMHFTPGTELAKGMSYLRITTPETGPDRWTNIFARGIYNVSIDYVTGFSAEIENGGNADAGKNSFVLNFSKPVFCDDGSWLSVLTGSGEECTIEDIIFSDDNKSCTVILAENLEEEEYKVLIGEQLKDEFDYICNTPSLTLKAEYPGATAEIENTQISSLLPEIVINFDREMNDISASDITITGITGKQAKIKNVLMSEDKKSCTVVLNNAEEGDYTLILGDNITDTDGNSVKTAYRKHSISIFVPGETAELDDNGVIELSKKKVTILFSGQMNAFGKDDIVITKDSVPLSGFTVSMAEDRKSAAVNFSELSEGTYYIEFTDNVTDITYNVPVLEKCRRLEFTAVADRTAEFETASADYENQSLRLIFSHAMDTLDASLITIRNASGDTVTAESIKMSDDGTSCELVFAQLDAGEYTVEFSEKYYDKTGYSLSTSCRKLSFEIIDYGTSAELEENTVKAENGSVTVIFGEEIDAIDASMITVRDSFENEVTVSSIEMSADRLKCKVMLAGLGKDSYTMYLSSGIRTVSGHTVNNSYKTLEFTATDDRAGKRVLLDDFGYSKSSPDISKIHSASDELAIKTTTGFTPYTIATATTYAAKEKIYALSAGPGLVSPYVIYRTDGIISEFSINVMYWGVSSNLHDGKFSFYVSDDAENWTPLSAETEYSESIAERTDYDTNWYRKTYKSFVQLSGHNANYIKICYPVRAEGVSNNTGWGARNLTSVQISYNYGEGSAKVRETGTENNGKNFYADIAFMNPLNESNISPGYFTVENSDIKCYSVSYNSDKRVLRLFFDKAFEFSKEYTLAISDELTDEYGFGIIDESKKLTLDFSEPDTVIINTDNPFNTSEIKAGSNITCNVNLTANYAGGGSSQEITVVAVMTRDGKICAIDSDSKILDVGNSGDFSAELKAPTNITAREEVKVRVYIIDSWRNLQLLSDKTIEL